MMATTRGGPTGKTPHEEALARPQSKALAIRAKCWDCEGGDADPGWKQRVRGCVVTGCPLWHVRPYRGRGSGRSGPETARKGQFRGHRIDSGEAAEPSAPRAG